MAVIVLSSSSSLWVLNSSKKFKGKGGGISKVSVGITGKSDGVGNRGPVGIACLVGIRAVSSKNLASTVCACLLFLAGILW